ncbi:hypothetical protein [Mucisphaera calidilacus]|uniref:PDZ domain-containing protein n=1 Tax=Mucisphaera calidilacus TaxID=2527982 RepID=A0A518BTS6_9BACT|nr:hypothetical protein [Mucisphaera calidilacus]QDU70359.1 hypothetical protein Pan265_01850 [Mucisphaera calidilacus]
MLVPLCVSPADALPLQDGTPEADPLVMLESEDWAERDAATHRLLADHTLTAEAVREACVGASLEAQQRLMTVARHHFLRQVVGERFPNEGQGAVGIVQRDEGLLEVEGTPRASIAVIRTLPGFPAYETLRLNDRIVQVNGDWLDTSEPVETIRQASQQTTPGRMLSFAVIRDGVMIECKVGALPLAALRTLYQPGPYTLVQELDDAWMELREKLLPPDSPLLDTSSGLDLRPHSD